MLNLFEPKNEEEEDNNDDGDDIGFVGFGLVFRSLLGSVFNGFRIKRVWILCFAAYRNRFCLF